MSALLTYEAILAEAIAEADESTSQGRVRRMALRVERDLFRLENRTLAEIRAALVEARKEIIVRLADATADWQREQLQALLAETERQMRRFEQAARTATASSTTRAADMGAEAAMRSLEQVNIDLGTHPALSAAQIAVSSEFSAVLIRNVTEEVIRKVDVRLRRAVLALESPFEVMRDLGPIAGKGVFASAFHRAESIVRTELGRIFQAANDATLRELARRAEIGKEWLTVLDRRTRPAHVAAHGQVRRIDEPFDVGGEKLMYPLDPRGSAANTINCRCKSIPTSPLWRPELAGSFRLTE